MPRPRWTFSAVQCGAALRYVDTVALFVTANKLTTAANAMFLQCGYVICRIQSQYVKNTILTHYCENHIFFGMKELARDPRQIGNLIRRARKRKALSQKALASMVGLRQENISMLENGYASAKLHNLLAVLAALDLELQVSIRSTGDWTSEE